LIQIHKVRQAPPAAGANRAVLIKHLEAARESLETESYSYNTEDNTVTLNPDTVDEKAKADAVERIARRSMRQADLRNQRVVPDQSNFLQQHDQGLRQTTDYFDSLLIELQSAEDVDSRPAELIRKIICDIDQVKQLWMDPAQPGQPANNELDEGNEGAQQGEAEEEADGEQNYAFREDPSHFFYRMGYTHAEPS
jgi:hypothetical protein